ncbi:hypothetical protein Cni_G07110 [Canna indica]|uniref:Uncharacterized protein n=1 Tax=Canna indica TaxID=4628 RepID=A0AAQ3JZS8_9LILI|nr:hypothetical protein Cni_G07110 [Canna indica]
MAADSNMGSYQANIPSTFHHPLMVSFQSGAMDSLTGMISDDMRSLGGNSSMVGMLKSASSGMISHMSSATPIRYPAGTALHEPTPRFMHVSGSPAYWSPEEVEILHIGLVKHANEVGIRKYTKIASMLPQKTIRDVALRCQWMTHKENGKRRKIEEYYAAKKIKDMKDKTVGSASTVSIHMAPKSLATHHINILDQLPSEEMKRLLDENDGFLKEIERNLDTSLIEDNINLFYFVGNNVSKIENRINVMSTSMKLPGSMRQMPLLPLSVNYELLSSLIPHSGNVINSTPKNNHLQLDACFRPNMG